VKLEVPSPTRINVCVHLSVDIGSDWGPSQTNRLVLPA